MPIELIIFDLDGVLISSREWHYTALNQALTETHPECVISESDHIARFDGLPTTTKLNILHKERGLPTESFPRIWARKQEVVLKLIDAQVHPNQAFIALMALLQGLGYKVACCSNSVLATLDLILRKMGLLEFMSTICSNDNAELKSTFPKCGPKPHPAMFMFTCLKVGVSPRMTLVCEDSHFGRKSALEAGCWLCPIENPEHLTFSVITKYIAHANTSLFCIPRMPWIMTPDMNVLIPMAGRGSRFEVQKFQDIKPMIPVRGTMPMIQVVVRNLNITARHLFIAQAHHIDQYRLSYWLPIIVDSCTLVSVTGLTEGAACTTLLAKEYIDNDNPLLIANSDQFVEFDMNAFMYRVMNSDIDGGILCFNLDQPDCKWSFVEMDDRGLVKQVYEKSPVSRYATVGIYFWKRGSDYVRYATEMVSTESNKINGEFYVAPVYNFAIRDGKKIVKFDVHKMWGLGVPEDLLVFQENYHGPI
jgi:beta-phosphoglucomutase-like phosphatase (HAD superfamily)/dTDP-glucose pyrophosphorylase